MSNTLLALLFVSVSQTYSLPPGLLSALCWVESKHDIGAIHRHDGHTDSLGVCQIKVATAKCVGFKGNAEALSTPEVNVVYAAKYLAYNLRRYSGDPRKAIAAYNAGAHRTTPEGLTKNRAYVSKVFQAWATDR